MCTKFSNPSSLISASSGSKPFFRLPELTDGEKDLLRAHSGCFKCRRFNAGHGSSAPTCPGFPPANSYKTITKFADAAGHPAFKQTSSSTLKGKTIASLIEGAFTPSAVLGNGTESGESDIVSELAL